MNPDYLILGGGIATIIAAVIAYVIGRRGQNIEHEDRVEERLSKQLDEALSRAESKVAGLEQSMQASQQEIEKWRSQYYNLLQKHAEMVAELAILTRQSMRPRQ